MKTPLFGPFYVSRSSNYADNRLVNAYAEIAESKGAAFNVGALYGTPGMDFLQTIGGGPVRALHVMGPTLYAVSGPDLYALANDFSYTRLGGDIGPGTVSVIDNGFQLAVFGGNTGHTWSPGPGYANIALPFLPLASISAAQQDGFGVINQPGIGTPPLWWQSNLLDLTAWNALNFGDASGDPDNIVAMAQINREIWLIKEKETEVWYNAGTPGFTFARLDEAYVESGIVAQGSLAKAASSLIWLARNNEGEGIFVQSVGHAVKRISTHAIEDTIGQYATRADCTAYVYQQDGHQFYVANFPTGNASWCYDATESALAGQPIWHERAAFDERTGLLSRHWANCQVAFAGKVVVGDYRNGNLYAFNLETLTDNGTPRKFLRSWRALPEPVNRPVRFDELRIDMQTGIGVAEDANPQMVLRWSDDGGHNWSNEVFADVGKTGQTARRVMYRRMGSTKRNAGLDRIYEISTTDAFPVAIVGAELEAA
jgi:hypothetical protein